MTAGECAGPPPANLSFVHHPSTMDGQPVHETPTADDNRQNKENDSRPTHDRQVTLIRTG